MAQEESSTPGVERVRRYPCPGCGADLVFEPVGGCLVCPYCGRRERIEFESGEVADRDFAAHLEYLRARPERLSTPAAGALEVKCDRCGASVIFTPPEVAGECDFCGGKIVAQPRSADPLIAPEGVLPFGVTAEQAGGAVRRWVAGLWFAPNALKRLASHQPVGGVYIPFWTYDAHATTRYAGQRGEHYYVTERYTTTNAQGQQESHTRRVRHTRWHPAAGTVARWFDDMLIPATKSLPPARLRALEPWDLPALRAYEPAYLSGYKAQRYQVDLAEGFDLAKQLTAPAIERDVRDDIGGDEQQITDLSTHYSAITFKHLLLPVYVGAYHFSGKIYQVVVNGRTGEVQGERPYSVWKILLLALLILLVLGIAALLFGGSER